MLSQRTAVTAFKKSTKINENKCYHIGLLSQHGTNYQNLWKTNAVTENRYHSVENKIKIHENKCYHSEELSQRLKKNGQNQGTQRYQSVEKEMTKSQRKQALGLR